MTTINKAKLRRDIGAKLAQMFIDSGVEYTCTASVYSVIRDQANEEAIALVLAGVVISKSQYDFNMIPCTRDILMSTAAKMVRRKYFALDI